MLLFLGAIAFVVALIGVPFERITVTLITSVCGALTAVTLAYDLQQTEYDLVMWIIVLVLASLGMIFQFKPWKDRGYEEEDEEEENYRRSRKQHRRSRTPSRSTVSRTSGKRKKKKASAVLPVTVPPGAVLPAAVQRYLRIPCTISVLSRKNRMTQRKRMTKNSWNVRRADHPDRKTPVPEPSENPSPAAGDTRPIPDPRSVSAEPDLSEIRQQISAEVQEIYRDSQEHTDDF